MAIVQFLNRKYSTVRCASFCLNGAYLRRHYNQRDIWIQFDATVLRSLLIFNKKWEYYSYNPYSTARVLGGVYIGHHLKFRVNGYELVAFGSHKESLCSSMEMTYFQIYLRYRIPIRCYTFTWITMYQPWRQFRLKYQVVDKCSDESNGIVANSLKRVKSKSVVRITNCWWNEFQFGGVLLSNWHFLSFWFCLSSSLLVSWLERTFLTIVFHWKCFILFYTVPSSCNNSRNS